MNYRMIPGKRLFKAELCNFDQNLLPFCICINDALHDVVSTVSRFQICVTGINLRWKFTLILVVPFLYFVEVGFRIRGINLHFSEQQSKNINLVLLVVWPIILLDEGNQNKFNHRIFILLSYQNFFGVKKEINCCDYVHRPR